MRSSSTFTRLAGTLGTVGSSVFVSAGIGYALITLSGKVLTPAESVTFLGFWGVLMGVASALSPIEQELSRQAALASTSGTPLGGAAVRVFAVVASTALLVGISLLVPAVNHRLFGDHYGLGVLAAAGIVTLPALYAARGIFAGRNEFRPYSCLVLSESAIRLALFLGFAWLGAARLVPLAVAVTAGFLAWVPFGRRVPRLVDTRVTAEPWGPVVRRMSALMVAAALTASVITGFPAVVKWVVSAEDSTALAGVFLAVTLVRSPLLLLLAPVQSLAVPGFVRVLAGDAGTRRIRRLLVLGCLVTTLVAVLAGIGAFFLGPWLFHLLYQDKYQVTGWMMASLGWSGVLLGATMLVAAILVASGKTGQVLVAWAVVALAGPALLSMAPGDLATRLAASLALAPTAGLAVAVTFVLASGRGAKGSTD
ncbi:lipopolysaccharide biosynthesis protein [Amycolatopsis sp. NPDC049868]|uniref:lipopolysaccharide biosynthesis protein n=1 Tax=Amycolatopsis sp. NPDC049868 TaxID=3363934 RepID=UPI0037B62469